MAADRPMLAKHVNATGHVMNALEKEPGAAVLFAVNKEFGKSVDCWFGCTFFLDFGTIGQDNSSRIASPKSISSTPEAQHPLRHGPA